MIAPVDPVHGEHITVDEIEKRLVALKCTKVEARTKTVCIWRAPNGRHFTAPNPATMYMVPTSAEHRLLNIMANLDKLPGLDGDSEMPGREE